MQAKHLTRRFMLLLPLAVAACGGYDEEDQDFAPLRYNDLPPIQLKVASIAIEQRFVPSGVPPDVSDRDPASPIEALKAMANDRLQAFGTANKAVFSILDASLTREDDVVSGSLTVSLAILDDSGAQLGYAQAHEQSRRTGRVRDLRSVLYDMTKAMMNDMNIEFEYQIRHHLKPWLTDSSAPAAPVEQTPLDGTQAPPVTPPAAAPSAAPGYPPASQQGPQPTYLQPPQAAYPQPAQPGYPQPAQPAYSQPAQPGYPQPAQPAYSQPAQPTYLQPPAQ
jgi:hypothetical protein